MRWFQRLQPILEHRWLPLWVAALAVLLASPSLTTGWVLDDYGHRTAALGSPEDMPPDVGRFDMFTMSRGNPETIRYFKNMGFAPWWTPEDFKLGFWRPLASAHHFVQYQLWPHSPVPMHAVSLAWLAVATYLAALVYRRFIGVRWIAGLAALLYAVQPGHAMTAGWIANQNALLSVTFGLGAILAHDRWRVEQWKPGAVIGPSLLMLSVLSAESGTAAGAYLLAYGLLADPSKMRPRGLLFLAPHVAVGLVWASFYKMRGYTVDGSGFYIDPAGQPAEFLRAALERVPVQLAAIWGLLPATVVGLMSGAAQRRVAAGSAVFVLLLLAAMLPLLRRKASSQFFFLGMALALLPTAATFPSERNLMWAGLGAMGLLAQWIGSVTLRRREAAEGGSGGHGVSRAPSWAARLAAAALLMVHLVLAPLSALGNSRGFASFKTIRELGFANVLQDEKVREQMVVFVNPPIQFMVSSFPTYRAAIGQPVPRRFRVLASGVYPLRLTRLNERTLALRCEGGGILQPVGTWDVPGQPKDPVFSVNYLALVMDRVFRSDSRPFTVGETSVSELMTARVVELAPGGGVREVHFTFDVPLEDEALRWVRFQEREYVEFTPPAVGQSVDLAGVNVGEVMVP